MNKKAIGKFILELRKKKGKTQSDLSAFLENEENIIVSTNAISSWERGITIPEIDTLRCLSNYYDITVNEILNAEKLDNVDLEEKYQINEPEFGSKNYIEEIKKYFDKRKVAEDIAKKNVKVFFKKLIDNKITVSERKEFEFILINFYKVEEDEIPEILFEITAKNGTFSEKWWEMQKHLSPIGSIDFNASCVADEAYEYEECKENFVNLEDWQKDLFLTSMQNENFVSDPDFMTDRMIDAYEKRHNRPYDKEQIIKRTMKFLIQNGAKLNNHYFSYANAQPVRRKCKDIVDYSYDRAFKDIEFCNSYPTYKFYKAKNTPKNRLVIYYYYPLISEFVNLGFTTDEAINLILNNDDIPQEFLEKFHEKNRPANSTRTINYMSLLNFINPYFVNEYYEYKALEKEIIQAMDDYEIFSEEIKNGNLECTTMCTEYVGGKNFFEIKAYALDVNQELSYNEFLSGRLKDKTKALFEDIDSLSIAQLRNKYFYKEIK